MNFSLFFFFTFINETKRRIIRANEKKEIFENENVKKTVKIYMIQVVKKLTKDNFFVVVINLAEMRMEMPEVLNSLGIYPRESTGSSKR